MAEEQPKSGARGTPWAMLGPGSDDRLRLWIEARPKSGLAAGYAVFAVDGALLVGQNTAWPFGLFDAGLVVVALVWMAWLLRPGRLPGRFARVVPADQRRMVATALRTGELPVDRAADAALWRIVGVWHEATALDVARGRFPVRRVAPSLAGFGVGWAVLGLAAQEPALVTVALGFVSLGLLHPLRDQREASRVARLDAGLRLVSTSASTPPTGDTC